MTEHGIRSTSMDDLSRISGISNISRISKANNSTLYKWDVTSNVSEWRSCRDITRSFTTDSQKGELKRLSESAKVSKVLAACEESTCEYAKQKLIYDCLVNIVDNKSNILEADTMKKLMDFIIINKVKKCLYLPNHSKDVKDELTLLGIIDLPQHEFNYEEQLSIKSSLEAELRERIHSFLTTYENAAGSTKEAIKSNESLIRSRFQQNGELDNLSWGDKINEVCLEHKRDLVYCLKSLKRWHELKCEIQEKSLKDTESLLLQSKIAELKAMITKLSCTIRMYKETPVTIDAFRALSSTLDERIANVSDEIAEKTELKKAYDALNGTEYDEILRKYLETCRVISKKKNLLDKFETDAI
ncbi:uncharacterized protein LOC106641527 [Copidosoma floridanum]|uniref:uncharacterized protein LOC106641527 n=1 Tax=Copidosoma floridanum TaxID=29053 RepID=UPI0006C94251|nr:uncharacterized protein LOC106641527 [Copidosoma floridanum]